MNKKNYAVTGATGHVGKVVVEKLKAQGHRVSAISRSAGIPFDDVARLTRAFAGADGVFVMIPPDVKTPDLRKTQNDLGKNLADAVKAAGVRRVVFLSSINAHLEQGTGPILGLHDMEVRLNGMGFAELVHLRPAYFMTNHLWGIGLIAQEGMYGTAFRPDVALPMIAPQDIGDQAALLLMEEPFTQPRTRELLGSRDYSMMDVARILGAAIGKPDLKYVQFPYEEARKAMIAMGISPSYADGAMEIARSFNEGKAHGIEKRSADNTTSTTLEQFAKDDFRKAFGSMKAGVR